MNGMHRKPSPIEISFRKKRFKLRSSEDTLPLMFQLQYIMKSENKLLMNCADVCFKDKDSLGKDYLFNSEKECLKPCFQKQRKFYSQFYHEYINADRNIDHSKQNID